MRKQTKKWKTKDGSKIRICDMTNSHLINVLKHLKRKAEQTRSIIDNLLWSQPAPRGAMARIAVEDEQEAWADATWEDVLERTPSLFEELHEEAFRRGLDTKFLYEEAPPKKDRFKRAGPKCSK